MHDRIGHAKPDLRRGFSEDGVPEALGQRADRIREPVRGIARTADDLQSGLAALGELRARAGRVGVDGNRQYNPGWHTTLDLRNLLTVSEAVTRAALARRESRGAHTRVEHPDSDKRFGTVNVVVRRQGDAMTVVEEPIVPVPGELRDILEGKD